MAFVIGLMVCKYLLSLITIACIMDLFYPTFTLNLFLEMITKVLFKATTRGFLYYNPWHFYQGSSYGLSSKVTFEELKGGYQLKVS